MIYYLEGEVVYLRPLFAIVNVSGVGYGLHIPLTVSEKLKVGSKTKFFTRAVFKENEQKLFGFFSLAEAEFFEFLCSLPGVGAALSFHLVSALATKELLAILEKGEVTKLTKIPRVGKSRAERIIFECRKRTAKLRELQLISGDSMETSHPSFDDFLQVKEALLQLGFKAQEIERAKNKIQKEKLNLDSLSVQDLVRIYLRYL